jgi:serine/threonine protein phosphatase PrpC
LKAHCTSFGLPGSRHQESEDVYTVTRGENDSILAVLSDGVGSARDPRRSAERVVRLVSEHFFARPKDWSVEKTLTRLIGEANDSLTREGVHRDGIPSMQATLSALLLEKNIVSGVNVGDSPIFLIRGEMIRQLSATHTAPHADGGEMLTHAVGMGEGLRPHVFKATLEKDDLVVLCSDGVLNLLGEKRLGDLAKHHVSARTLVMEAQELAGSKPHDDLSAILIHIQELSPTSLQSNLSLNSTSKLPALVKGAVIEEFELLRTIGDNERVWLAEREGRRFVLKFMPRKAVDDPSSPLREAFLREAWNATRFETSFFVKSYRPESGSHDFFIMEYIEAPSLAFLLKSKLLGIEETVGLGCFLCHACQWLLGHELIHGDIKTDNVLIYRTDDGVGFKLLDLGIASPVFTDSGSAGTASYLAPERFDGGVVCERTEIFAIGVTLYQVMTGHLPYGEIERFQKPSFKRPRRLSALNPNTPPWLEAVIFKAIAIRPERRYEHFSEMLYDLQHPDQVTFESLFQEPLIARDPLLFYKTGFWILLIALLLLLFKISIH